MSNVVYHVGKLKKLDVIEMVGTKKVGGATEHFYAVVDDENLQSMLASLEI